MNLAIFAIGLLVYGIAIRQDIRTRTIPDGISLVVCVMGLCRWMVGYRLTEGLWAVFVAVILFLALVFAYRRGWLGGGDVKLMTATAFLVGASDFMTWFVVMTLLGGVVSIIVVARYWALRLGREKPVHAALPEVFSQPTVPYGIAISLSALWVLFLQTGLKG